VCCKNEGRGWSAWSHVDDALSQQPGALPSAKKPCPESECRKVGNAMSSRQGFGGCRGRCCWTGDVGTRGAVEAGAARRRQARPVQDGASRRVADGICLLGSAVRQEETRDSRGRLQVEGVSHDFRFPRGPQRQRLRRGDGTMLVAKRYGGFSSTVVPVTLLRRLTARDTTPTSPHVCENALSAITRRRPMGCQASVKRLRLRATSVEKLPDVLAMRRRHWSNVPPGRIKRLAQQLLPRTRWRDPFL
jgi:hypothetical protein